MPTYVQPSDFDAALPTVSATRLDEVIADAEAMATLFAPGLKAAAFLADADKMAQAKAILRAAVIYQCEPVNDGDRPRSPTILAPSQVDALRALTRGTVALGGVYTVSLAPDL
jgi:hypothetical protein